MGDLIRIPFKIEDRQGVVRGYPTLNWFYDGLRYESLLDTGADNNVFPLQFLILLDQKKIVDLDEIYIQNKFGRSSGIGGSMLLTHPISIKIELRLNGKNIMLTIPANFCIPDNKGIYEKYIIDQTKLPTILASFNATKDTRHKANLEKEYIRIQKNIQKFNPPFLFGKPFISKLDYLKFSVDNEMANEDSHFEFSVKDSCIDN